jgi:hypothetical protein
MSEKSVSAAWFGQWEREVDGRDLAIGMDDASEKSLGATWLDCMSENSVERVDVDGLGEVSERETSVTQREVSRTIWL